MFIRPYPKLVKAIMKQFFFTLLRADSTFVAEAATRLEPFGSELKAKLLVDKPCWSQAEIPFQRGCVNLSFNYLILPFILSFESFAWIFLPGHKDM